MNSLELDEISELATKLQEKTDAHILTLDDICRYIENRKISEFQALFDSDAQQKQAYRMFYYYDKKGWKQSSEQQIVYRNHSMIAVRAWSGYSEYRGVSYHAVWCVGISEAQVWIHRLEWSEEFENDSFVWSEEYVKKKMGFNDDLSENTIFEKDKAIRVQGDLIVRQTKTFAEYINEQKESEAYPLRRKFFKLFEEHHFHEIKQDEEYKKMEQEIDTVNNIRSKRSKQYNEQKEELKKKYNVKKLDSKLVGLLEYDLSKIYQKLLDKKKEELKYKEKEEQYINEKLKDFKVESIQKQENIRIGNHLLIIEKADRLGGLGSQILVCENTVLYCIHDEHMNTKAILPPGLYSFGLLQRHRTDRR